MTGKWAATNTLREKADLFVRTGFRDEDGVWHAGPHRIEFDAALALVEAALDSNAQALDAYYQFTPHMSYCAPGPNNDPPCDCGRDVLDVLYKESAAALRAVREDKT